MALKWRSSTPWILSNCLKGKILQSFELLDKKLSLNSRLRLQIRVGISATRWDSSIEFVLPILHVSNGSVRLFRTHSFISLSPGSSTTSWRFFSQGQKWRSCSIVHICHQIRSILSLHTRARSRMRARRQSLQKDWWPRKRLELFQPSQTMLYSVGQPHESRLDNSRTYIASD